MRKTKGQTSQKIKKGLVKVSGVLALIFSVIFGFSFNAEASVATAWQCPVNPWEVTYSFGAYAGAGRYHLGDDSIGNAGDPVRAAANGVVKALYNFPGPYNYGGLILIENNNADGSKVVSLYGHLNAGNFKVKEGQQVTRGQVIGYLGNYEQNGGWIEHIHFGIRKGEYVASPWVYWGYGSFSMLAEWYAPSSYIERRKDYIEVKRVPSNSPNRYSTAVGVSKRLFPQEQTADTVFVASGETFVDALAATPLLSIHNGSLLLTQKNSLPKETLTEIQRILPKGKTIRIIGGNKAITPEVAQTLEKYGYKVSRVAGKNRDDTAARIANSFKETNRAFLVSDQAFPDAVSAGGPAIEKTAPLLLTDPNKLSTETENYLKNHKNIERIYLLGGNAAVSKNVQDKLASLGGLKISRIAGANRYETNVKVVKLFKQDPESLIFATGVNYPDALTGSSLVSKENGSLLLAQPSELAGSTLDYIEQNRNKITKALVLGGGAAINTTFDTSLAAILNAPISAASAQDFNWQAAEKVEALNTKLPVPSGYSLTTNTYRGANVAAVELQDKNNESVPPIEVIRINKGSNIHDSLAEWFNVPLSSIKETRSDKLGYKVLVDLPSIAKTTTAYFEQGQELIIFKIRVPEDQIKQVLDELVLSTK